jgi:hypothetical protein
VPYPEATEYQAIAPGQYDVQVVASDTQSVVLQVSGWSIAPGAQSSIVIVRGLDGKLDVAPLSDAAAVAVAPVGGVQTDLGRSNEPDEGGNANLGQLALLVGLPAAAALLLLARRCFPTVR